MQDKACNQFLCGVLNNKDWIWIVKDKMCYSHLMYSSRHLIAHFIQQWFIQ